MNKKLLIFLTIAGLLIGFVTFYTNTYKKALNNKQVLSANHKKTHWFVLYRKSNKEYLFEGIPGDKGRSKIIKTFNVKTGMPGERPTPLPQLLGRQYWLLVKKEATVNPETAPYFLTLDIPTSDEWPYGPTPYFECNGQCDWVTVGYFGLHGVNGNPSKLSDDDPGSSGCIRHMDEDIAFLYDLLNPEREEIRYYIKDI